MQKFWVVFMPKGHAKTINGEKKKNQTSYFNHLGEMITALRRSLIITCDKKRGQLRLKVSSLTVVL